jgi:hypothetical protein
VLPKLLGVSDRVAFLATSLAFSLVFFLFIRGRVFHGAATLDVVPAESPSRAFR